ncbi:AIR synthase related protein domain protein [Emticicia oligotrophica DSM 17448]|uniref:AIR synthase related protein domain protein n=1 Tax=Emticicia oligotrophica (strain DSM 17448 / CIP 109782 / MTCC 6937 / GPTSA100-15) TaxID=929562 RepID=A0ABM5N362_EMTOG|nr:AIR synthase family protein [Emticicia oligotrophica]AFK03861.1 AIR synthase related protein domain protein [Emticicia oligotrophica DSM 17448]
MENIGKINEEYFKKVILPNSGFKRKEVVIGPNFGVDVALVELPNNMAMALTSDPLSLIPTLGLQESAWLSVHLMANDIATTSFAPMYLQTVLNLPTSISDAQFREYWQYIDKFCKEIGVAITGGHTGTIEGQNSTISGGGTLITIAPQKQILTSNNAQIGDSIIMTKQCAMSSVSILAMSFPKTIRQKLGTEVAQKAEELFYHTSVLNEALVINKLNQQQKVVNAMHDVTEGGVLGAAFEMAIASGLGIEIQADRLNISPIVSSVCEVFSFDPRYCIGAGSMIISVKHQYEELVINALHENNIEACTIGSFTALEEGHRMVENDEVKPMTYHETDPYWAAFFEAFKRGWK